MSSEGMSHGTRRVLEDLRKARVLVVHPRDEDGAILIEHLRRIGCAVRAAWPPPTILPREIDTLFVQVDGEVVEALSPALDRRDITVVAVATYESPTTLNAIIELNAHGVVSKPLRSSGILTSFVLARYRCSYEGRLESKAQKLEETMKARRSIEKAVKVLSNLNHIEEEEAYRTLRDQASAKRCTMASIAETILSAHEALKDLDLNILRPRHAR